MPHATVLLGAVVAALLGLVGGRLVTTRLDERPLSTAWPVAVRRRRDVVVPVLLAVALAGVVLRFGYAPDLPAYVYFAVVTIALATVDVAEKKLPDRMTLPSYPIGLALLAAAAPFVPDGWARLLVAVVAMVVSFLGYGLLYLVGVFFLGGEAFGGGDVKLGGVLGLYLGWLAGYTALAGAFLGIVYGGLFALGLVALRRATRKDTVPFGPFMIAGAFTGVLVPAITSVVSGLYG